MASPCVSPTQCHSQVWVLESDWIGWITDDIHGNNDDKMEQRLMVVQGMVVLFSVNNM